MIRLALAVFVTIAIVVFAMSNSHHVNLSCMVGPGVQVRLIFLLLIAFLSGIAVPIFYGLIRRLEREKQLRRENELRRMAECIDPDIGG
ncbi:hypothetical protein ACFL5Q_02425 [Planctomycetota bacterium]